jgi:hypothetical protein
LYDTAHNYDDKKNIQEKIKTFTLKIENFVFYFTNFFQVAELGQNSKAGPGQVSRGKI